MRKRTLALALLAVAAGCSTWRWKSRPLEGGALERTLRDSSAADGLHPPPVEESSDGAARLGPPRAPRAGLDLPASTPERLRSAVYYSDLGPDEIDVSSYPAQQRYNYEAYARVCSGCHGLARSVNAPMASRAWWEFYVMSMRLRGRLSGRPLTAGEIKSVLDFLEYDGRERKVKRAREFEARSAELRRRFDAAIAEKLRRYQRERPLLPKE
ncbi:MAG: hypothetical protein HY403_06760 [Elusimicrobia bacterium]|nr:hypothetical protein [Elusimicrobiota bacterium]